MYSLSKIHNNYFAADGTDVGKGAGLSSIIFNCKGEIINIATHPCRWGEFQHISTTSDKQLLYSGKRVLDYKQKSPHFLKTNLSFLENIITDQIGRGEKNKDNLTDTQTIIKNTRIF